MAPATSPRSRDRLPASSVTAATDLSAFEIDSSVLLVGNLELLPAERLAFVAGKRAHLTRREFDVLLALAVCQRLRETAPGSAYIHTHFGHGYRLEPERVGRGRGQGRAR